MQKTTIDRSGSARRRLTPAAMAAVAALAVSLLAGCGTSTGGATTSSSPAIDDAQALDTYYQCLLDAGVPATRDDQGAVAIRAGTDADEKKYAAIEKQCTAKLGNTGAFPTTAEAELDSEYRALTALHVCLVDAGFPLTDWPTKEVFEENDGDYNVLDATSAIDETAARKACPEQFQAVDSL